MDFSLSGTKQRKTAVLFDSDDEGSVSSSSTAMSDLTLAETDQKKIPPPETEEDRIKKDLDDCLDALYEKRGATREKALTLIVDSFRNKLQHQFVANKFITILHQCLNSVKKGSSKEIHLASLAIGLLAITVGCDDSATHELLEESFTPLSQALKSGSESLKISSILDCLAVITFIGGICPDETERAMQMIWQFVRPKSGPNVVATKPTVTVLTAAISAWAFLFTSMDGWKINSKESQESVSYLSTLLDKEDRSVRMAAGEAIAVIFEVGNLDRLHRDAKSSSDISASERNSSVEGYQQIQGLKAKILDQVRKLSVEAGGKGSAKKDLNTQKNLFKDVVEFLEDGYPPETSMKVGGDVLNISTWAQLIQMNFLKRFLASSFAKHMLDNEFLQDVFEFDPKKKQSSGNAHHLSSDEKRLFKSPNSVVSKARTQYLNKTRMLSQGRNAGHFTVGGDDE